MPTPKTGYYTAAGVRVPGVTTVLGRFKESGALIYWSWNLAYVPYRQARAQIEKIVAQGAIDPGTLADCKDLLQVPIERADFRHVRDNAASIGTIVHARIEAWTHGIAFNQTPYPEADVLASDIGFSAFLEWAGSTKFSLAETEMQLVSEKYGYGGTPDVIMIREQRTTGDYKGLAVTTKLPTPSGWITMGEIQVGDQVFDENGTPCDVIGTSEVSHKRCFRLTFDDKSSVVCDVDHLWLTMSGQEGGQKMILLMRPEELMETIFRGGARHHRIPLCRPLECQEMNLPIDPYVLGAWLGDGTKSRGVICKPVQEFWNQLSLRGARFNSAIPLRDGRTIYGLEKDLRGCGLLNNKHIPEQYLRASIRQRTELLRGLLDTDGSWNKIRKQCGFDSTNKRLTDQVGELAISLGQRIMRFTGTTHGFGKFVLFHRIAFSPVNINPFGWRRTTEYIPSVRSSRRILYSVEEIDSVPTRCIKVNSQSNLYLCTENMIPTHNTGDLYPEQVLPQLAAYQKLLIEHGREIQDMGAHAMSINKKTGGFVHRYFTPKEVNRGWRAFELMLQLHSLIKELK